MAFPLLPAIGAGVAISKLFKKRPEYKTPEFFGGDYNQMITALTQATEAQYGGGLTDIREALANSGTLSPAALTDVSTEFNINKGRDILGMKANAYTNEYTMRREAEMEKNRLDYEAATKARGQELSFLGDIARAAGTYYGAKEGKKNKKDSGDGGEEDTSSQYFLDIPGYGTIRNPNYKSGFERKTRDVLKFLLGF